jgi:hypothetical protein
VGGCGEEMAIIRVDILETLFGCARQMKRIGRTKEDVAIELTNTLG